MAVVKMFGDEEDSLMPPDTIKMNPVAVTPAEAVAPSPAAASPSTPEYPIPRLVSRTDTAERKWLDTNTTGDHSIGAGPSSLKRKSGRSVITAADINKLPQADTDRLATGVTPNLTSSEWTDLMSIGFKRPPRTIVRKGDSPGKQIPLGSSFYKERSQPVVIEAAVSSPPKKQRLIPRAKDSNSDLVPPGAQYHLQLRRSSEITNGEDISKDRLRHDEIQRRFLRPRLPVPSSRPALAREL